MELQGVTLSYIKDAKEEFISRAGLSSEEVEILLHYHNMTSETISWPDSGFLGDTVVKNPPAGDTRDLGSVPGSGRSSGGGHGNPLQWSCPGKSHGQRSLAGGSPLGCQELDTTMWLGTHTHTWPVQTYGTQVSISKSDTWSPVTHYNAPGSPWTPWSKGKLFPN